MPTILLTTKYSQKALNIIQKSIPRGFVFLSLKSNDKKEFLKKASSADYFLAGGKNIIDTEIINLASKLKMIQRVGVGVDNLDLKTLKQKNIPVYINYGINSNSVVEHTILLILAVLRKILLFNSNIRRGEWSRDEIGVQSFELFNKKIGLVGLGNIGLKVSQILNVFGAEVFYYKPQRLNLKDEKKLNLKYCSFLELIKKVDILSLHCPLTSATKDLINNKVLSKMKPGSIIINTSRGKLINEKDLLRSLKKGRIGGAGLDVYSLEPLDKNSPFLKLDNVVLTPHIAGLTFESFNQMFIQAFRNISLFNKGELEKIKSKKLIF